MNRRKSHRCQFISQKKRGKSCDGRIGKKTRKKSRRKYDWA
jgi:hypothetical protein